jgi:hypothetical protein
MEQELFILRQLLVPMMPIAKRDFTSTIIIGGNGWFPLVEIWKTVLGTEQSGIMGMLKKTLW